MRKLKSVQVKVIWD